jgi:hypothetical protein
MKDLFDLFKSQPLRAASTLITGVLTVFIISVCGWILLTWKEPTPAPRLEADKGEIIRLTPAAMRQATYEFNRKMEAIERGLK